MQDPQKFQEFTNKAAACDSEVKNDLAVLALALDADGKYQLKKNNHVDMSLLRTGVEIFISENAEAILKYEKAQEAIHKLGAPNAVPALEVGKQLIEIK